MLRTQLLCTICLSLCSIITAANQLTDAVLPATLRAHLQAEQFGLVTSIRGLPLGVRDAMQTLFGGRLDIAEPGDRFQAGDVIVTLNLPIRRLVAAGCSVDHCLVYYEKGGIAHTRHVALFYWTPAATRFEWGGIAPSGLGTIDEVRKVILSGGIKGPARFW